MAYQYIQVRHNKGTSYNKHFQLDYRFLSERTGANKLRIYSPEKKSHEVPSVSLPYTIILQKKQK